MMQLPIGTFCMVEGVMRQEIEAAKLRNSPHYIYRPRIFMDGTRYCALYGDDIQVGITGFGETPAAAMKDFDRVWNGC
jgi:hypothetical protein